MSAVAVLCEPFKHTADPTQAPGTISSKCPADKEEFIAWVQQINAPGVKQIHTARGMVYKQAIPGIEATQAPAVSGTA